MNNSPESLSYPGAEQGGSSAVLGQGLWGGEESTFGMGSAPASCCGTLSACKAWDASQSCATLAGFGKRGSGSPGDPDPKAGLEHDNSSRATPRAAHTGGRGKHWLHSAPRASTLREAETENPPFCQHDSDWEEQECPDVLSDVPHPHFHILHFPGSPVPPAAEWPHAAPSEPVQLWFLPLCLNHLFCSGSSSTESMSLVTHVFKD